MNIKLLIGGQQISAQDSRTFERRDPVTGDVATTAAAASVSDALKAVDAAAAAFPAWSATGPGARRALLLKAADALEAKTPEIINLMITETGSTGPWAGFNCMLAASMLREAASITTQITGEVIPSNKPGTLAMAQRKALGVCVGAHYPWHTSRRDGHCMREHRGAESVRDVPGCSPSHW
jgi:acyl-CoA reductase-like NAD-dependent aldehyde dehydrogenase